MKFVLIVPAILFSISIAGCIQNKSQSGSEKRVRGLVDTIGFAQYPWQMDSILSRIDENEWNENGSTQWRLAICPHDDYTYVGSLYPQLLCNVTAPNLILIGVAHRAAQFSIEDRLVFETNTHWKGPWKDIPVSPLREEIFNTLKQEYAVINDSLHQSEHSLEALIPYLQYFNRDVSIIPILVPTMNPDRMQECGRSLADAIRKVAESHKWKWGSDYAIVVTTDAVHYGNEDWGGVDRAFFGCDDNGNNDAIEYEFEIMNNCLLGKIVPKKIIEFSSITLNPANYKEYKWTWCGRYSVPVALYTAYYLNDFELLDGELVNYSTSITRLHIPVDDIGMGQTAIATRCHWVGYAAIGYR